MEITGDRQNCTFGVAVKAMILKEGRKLLVIYKTSQEAAQDPHPEQRRDQPGGRVEFGEAPEEALKREILEEVNLTVRVLAPLQVWHYVQERFQLVGMTFVCEWISGEVRLGEEHDAYEWLTREEILLRGWEDQADYLQAFEYLSK